MLICQSISISKLLRSQKEKYLCHIIDNIFPVRKECIGNVRRYTTTKWHLCHIVTVQALE